MAERPAFQDKQYAFAAHIRDPERQPTPDGIEDRRMAIYRELFFNNLLNLVGKAFPVLKKLYGERWQRLVREFMIHHEAATPYFLEIPREFLTFLENEYERREDDPPFMFELAHYEWAELAVSVSDEEDDIERIDRDGDLLEGVPVKSVLAWLLAYRYPVHRISESYQPQEPGDAGTFLVVYRRRNDEMGFMEMNPVTAHLLELIEGNEQRLTGRELIEKLAAEIGWQDTDALLRHGAEAMREMRGAEILLGTRC